MNYDLPKHDEYIRYADKRWEYLVTIIRAQARRIRELTEQVKDVDTLQAKQIKRTSRRWHGRGGGNVTD